MIKSKRKVRQRSWDDALDYAVPIDDVSIDGAEVCTFCSGMPDDCTGECKDLPPQNNEEELLFEQFTIY